MKKKSQQETQSLYDFLSRLSKFVADEADLGTLVGLCVITPLAEFKTASKSDEEIKFQQVKCIYGGLSRVLEQLEGEVPKEPYHVICDLQIPVRNYLEAGSGRVAKTGGIKDPEKVVLLFDKMVATIDRDHMDYIRRRGLRLLEVVRRRGLSKQRKSILEGDYTSLEDCFVDGGLKYAAR